MAENKVLRATHGVPDNYGIAVDKVKMMDRDKIDDFKKLIRVLQEDNYRLEQERANLKHMMKQQSMMYSSKNPDQRYQQFNLNPDQVAQVDEFVWKLVNGETSEPADFYRVTKENEKLKAQMEALNDKGFDFIKDRLEILFKDLSGGTGGGFTGEQYKRILTDYAEMQAKLDQISKYLQNPNTPVDTGLNLTQGSKLDSTLKPGYDASFALTGGAHWNHALQPPQATVNADQTVSGYSHKFGSRLVVTGKGGDDRVMDAKDQYWNAFLQLQLQECFELNKRKDEALAKQKREIEHLYNRIKKYLLM